MIVKLAFVATLLQLLQLTIGTTVEKNKVGVTPKGANVCIEQKPELRTVNVTSLQSREVKEYEWCWKVPPRCPKWKTKMITIWKLENITRIVNKHQCCKGYEQVGDKCIPICKDPCLHGTCIEPEVCSCQPGFSGSTCSLVGCPEGNWGQDCSKKCPCENGGTCEPKTGVCQCLPGWEGLKCQNKCDSNQYGQDCGKKCSCAVGYQCHHVTGDCSPCQSGTYGDKCQKKCHCSKNGTALCYHVNGNCYCKLNYFGSTCEMLCPFGYLDGVCHQKPMEIGTCSCASELYRCDEEKGCVCKDGFDCEGGTHFIDFASLQAKSAAEESTNHAKNVSIIATVLLVLLIICILLVVFYRRRMKRMQKDLEHRSVRYIENSILDTQVKRNELIVTSTDALGQVETTIAPPSPSCSPIPNANLNNLGASASQIPEKNVNIDRFKLGLEDEDDLLNEEKQTLADGACCSVELDSQTKVLGDEEEELDNNVTSHRNINVFNEASPSKEKNNEKLANLFQKIKKSNIDMAMVNNSDGNAWKTFDEEEDDEEEQDPKMFVNNLNALDRGQDDADQV